MKPGEKVNIEQYTCTCGKPLQSGTHITGQPGQWLVPGATILICKHCYALHRWGQDHRPHPFTEADIREFKADPIAWFTILMAIDALKKAKAKMN
jgi:hypothetical protein